MNSILVVFWIINLLQIFVRCDLNIDDQKDRDEQKDILEYGVFDEER